VTLRILIIDDHAEFRVLLRHHLSLRWPAAELLEHDPATARPLADDFAGAGLDLVLLDYQFGGGENVVVKVMAQRLPSGEESKEAQRLTREYESISRVDSPRVVRMHELGVADGHVYLVMEYFPQGSLRDLLLGPLPRADVLAYVQQIAGALEIVHRAGILHRDLKPANIMLRTDGSLALIDFGTAKFAAGHAHTLTATGSVVGTPNYMSPEQCSGLELTAASDLYAVGILMYEMLTGELPYEAATPLAVLYKHQYAPLPKLPKANADLQPILDKLLAKQPEERYQRARELVQQLSALATRG